MAEEMKNPNVEQHDAASAGGVESTDRGMFDFLGKKKDEDLEKKQGDVDHQAISSEFEHKVHVSEPPKDEFHDEAKKGSLLDKLHRSNSSSSSSSSDEEAEEGGEKRKKKKDKKKKKEDDTTVPVEKCDDVVVSGPEEKKGLMDKIKEKLPGQGKKEEEVAVADGYRVPTSHPPSTDEHDLGAYKEESSTTAAAAGGEKKGFLEKIKEKLPGYHPKATTTGTEEVKDKDVKE